MSLYSASLINTGVEVSSNNLEPEQSTLPLRPTERERPFIPFSRLANSSISISSDPVFRRRQTGSHLFTELYYGDTIVLFILEH